MGNELLVEIWKHQETAKRALCQLGEILHSFLLLLHVGGIFSLHRNVRHTAVTGLFFE